jgi:ATP-binding cassette subfamily B protein
MKPSFQLVFQHDSMDCGPACLSMISSHYGKQYSLESLRKKTRLTKQGVSMYGLSEAAETIGFRATALRLTADQLKQLSLPCILHWNQNHFVVLPFERTQKKG